MERNDTVNTNNFHVPTRILKHVDTHYLYAVGRQDLHKVAHGSFCASRARMHRNHWIMFAKTWPTPTNWLHHQWPVWDSKEPGQLKRSYGCCSTTFDLGHNRDILVNSTSWSSTPAAFMEGFFKAVNHSSALKIRTNIQRSRSYGYCLHCLWVSKNPSRVQELSQNHSKFWIGQPNKACPTPKLDWRILTACFVMSNSNTKLQRSWSSAPCLPLTSWPSSIHLGKGSFHLGIDGQNHAGY